MSEDIIVTTKEDAFMVLYHINNKFNELGVYDPSNKRKVPVCEMISDIRKSSILAYYHDMIICAINKFFCTEDDDVEGGYYISYNRSINSDMLINLTYSESLAITLEEYYK